MKRIRSTDLSLVFIFAFSVLFSTGCLDLVISKPDRQTLLEIEPCYPMMLGGWKTLFPLRDFLFHLEGKCFLNITFACPMSDVVTENITVKVVLPKEDFSIFFSIIYFILVPVAVLLLVWWFKWPYFWRKNKSESEVKEMVDQVKEVEVEVAGELPQNARRRRKKKKPREDQGDEDDAKKVGVATTISKEIGRGGNGVVYEGFFDTRAVAVKKIARSNAATKEKEFLMSCNHQNIVRCVGVDVDDHYMYLSLERCEYDLHDLIWHCCPVTEEINLEDPTLKNILVKDLRLWDLHGYPSPALLNLMRDLVTAVDYLHLKKFVIHRDLNPRNVLINRLVKDGYTSLSAQICDMGISKLLGSAEAKAETKGCGTPGWRSWELITNSEHDYSVDLFSLGCILFFCLTKGHHPFGEALERESNIVTEKIANLSKIRFMPEAEDIITKLLKTEAESRPTATMVLKHPLLWDSLTRMSFLDLASEKLKAERNNSQSALLVELERSKNEVFSVNKWSERIDVAVETYLLKFGVYNFESVVDLIRAIRNHHAHYIQLPKAIQNIYGSNPEGFDLYWRIRFPALLMIVYYLGVGHFDSDKSLKRYYN